MSTTANGHPEVAGVISEGLDYSCEYRVRHRDGNVRCVHVRAARMQSDRSESAGFVGTIEDVTVRKRSEDDLRESKQQLEHALEELQAAQQQVIQQERLRALGTMASGIATISTMRWPPSSVSLNS